MIGKTTTKETNGLSPFKHQIIQLSAVTSVNSYEYIYDQYVMLSDNATITNSNIHNITIRIKQFIIKFFYI